MFETIFNTDWAVMRHRNGPLAIERASYLCYCASQGATRDSLRLKARSILWVAERISQDDFGRVQPERLREIVCGFAKPAVAATTAATLIKSARTWLTFLGWWYEPQAPIPFEDDLERFVVWMRDERGLTPCTIKQWRYRTAKFLCWCSDKGHNLETLQAQDIDSYFATYGVRHWSRVSAGHIATMLRVFLRHAATIGACSPVLARLIQGYQRYALESLPYALDWEDVRGLIASADGDDERTVRDRAILLLLAVYGLRRGEVAALRIDQVDCANGQLHIWRLKRRQPQLYPLVSPVAEALGRYIDEARPPVAYPEIFIRTCAPRVPITAPAIYNIVNRRLLALGLQAAHRGPHALRHSCAARLLAQGFTLKEIGDHLGHRSTLATMAYAKVDLASLRQVADFDMGGLQ
jgi:integrase/recombinase XerD